MVLRDETSFVHHQTILVPQPGNFLLVDNALCHAPWNTVTSGYGLPTRVQSGVCLIKEPILINVGPDGFFVSNQSGSL